MNLQRVTIVSIGSALLGLATSASVWAADLGPYPAYTPPPPEPVAYIEPAIWQGAYVGVNGGYGWSNSNLAEPDGAFGGGQLGYNWQRGWFVFGLEGDLQASDISASNDVGFGTATTDVDWFSTVRGRLGFAKGPWLLYATGGAAFADISNQAYLAGPDVTLRGSDTETGYAVGGGLEWAFAPNWSAKAEYLYLDFGDKTLSGGGNAVTFDNDFHTTLVGLNYRF